MNAAWSPLPLAGDVTMALLTIALLLAFARLVRGPSLPDRVVALDLVATAAVGLIAAFAIVSDQAMLLRTATVIALVTFVGTIAFAHYIIRRGAR